MKMLMLVCLVLVGCSNPKTITCKECGSSSVRLPTTILVNGVRMNQYMCPNHHVMFKAQ